jgi:gas vesicle protein
MAGIRTSGSFSLGLLVGGLIGTALALLLAPERGEETRRQVRSRAEPLAERAKDTVTRLARRGERPAEEGEEPTE